MTVNVLLFASYADAPGTSAMQLDVPDHTLVRDVIAILRRGAGGTQLPASLLVAVNRAYASLGDRIQAGDEIAIIPPVAGG